jgi:hypothetical protein
MAIPEKVQNFITFLNKYKERSVITGIILAFIFFISAGLLLNKINSSDENVEVPKLLTKVKLTVKDEGGKAGEKQGEPGTETFYLLPSPDMLLSQFEEMQNLREEVVQKKLVKLRVLWPLYFFEIKKSKTGKVAIFDVKKDGFGVMVQCNWNPKLFPELETLASGRRIWVGGEITGVATLGTGMVDLKLEHIDFSKDVPAAAATKKPDTVAPEKKKPQTVKASKNS